MFLIRGYRFRCYTAVRPSLDGMKSLSSPIFKLIDDDPHPLATICMMVMVMVMVITFQTSAQCPVLSIRPLRSLGIDCES